MQNKRKTKIIFFLLDGLGDNQNIKLNEKTALESAHIPTINRLKKIEFVECMIQFMQEFYEGVKLI